MHPDKLEFWIDLNLPPKMAEWLTNDFDVFAKSFKELNFENTSDIEVYKIAAKTPGTIIITTKDIDFVNFQNSIGTPPKILYLNIGNISNENLKLLIQNKFAEVIQLFLKTNKSLIEISTL
jgi:predicted nuclease of predicted toxin-antitoxin system